MLATGPRAVGVALRAGESMSLRKPAFSRDDTRGWSDLQRPGLIQRFSTCGNRAMADYITGKLQFERLMSDYDTAAKRRQHFILANSLPHNEADDSFALVRLRP